MPDNEDGLAGSAAGEPARPSLSPTVRRLELASLLKSARIEAGETLVTVAKALRYSAPTISRFESGERLPREQDVRMLCRFLEIDDEARVENLIDVLRGAENTGWWEDFDVSAAYQKFIGLEASATSLNILESLRVPALAMTPEYADALWKIWGYDEEELENRRMVLARRKLVLERPEPLALKMVIDEGVLHRVVGDRQVMLRQVEHLLALQKRADIEIRIIPFNKGAYFGLNGAFTILRLPVDAVEDTVYVDGLIGQFFFDTHSNLVRYERYFADMWAEPLSSEKTTLRLLREAVKRFSQS